MTAKTCLTVNCIMAALLIVFGVIVFGGCANDNDTSYNGAYSSDTARTSTSDKSVSNSNSVQAQPRDSATGMSEYDAAIDRAQAQNKPVYLFFSATWCGPCQSYKRTVLSDYEVKNALNTKVIFVSADIDRDKALTRKYNVSGVPAGFLIKVDDQGQAKTVNSHVGGMDKQEFMTFINK